MKRFTQELADCWEKEQKEFEDLYRKALFSIKHPHFQYAVITEKQEVKVKAKPFWKWFSGRRVVSVKGKRLVISSPGNYRR